MMQKTHIFEILQDKGLRWCKQGTWFGERLVPAFAAQRGGNCDAQSRTSTRQRHPESRRDGAGSRHELSGAGSCCRASASCQVREAGD